MNIIFTGVHGSHLYGTNTPESDTDFKSIFLPTAKEIILGNAPSHFTRNTGNSESKNSCHDVDNEFFSLQYFIDLAIKGETFALDMLHTPPELIKSESNTIWKHIQDNRHLFYTTNMKAYLGYVRKQAGKYGVKGSRLSALRAVKAVADELPTQRHKTRKEFDQEFDQQFKRGITKHIDANVDLKIRDHIKELPIIPEYTSIFKDDKGNTFYEVLGRKYQDTMRIVELQSKLAGVWSEYGERARKAEANEGIDWKAMHHACRGGLQLLEIYRTGDLKYPLYDAKFLTSIKQGNEPFKVVQEYLEDVVDNVEIACKVASKNGMPEKVDRKYWDKFILEVYGDIVVKDIAITKGGLE